LGSRPALSALGNIAQIGWRREHVDVLVRYAHQNLSPGDHDASGLAVELPPPTWSERTQTMEWKSGLFTPTSYTGYATFADRDTMRWKSLLKDWKGTVLLDLEGTSVRRK
jgi:hypothetical protein